MRQGSIQGLGRSGQVGEGCFSLYIQLQKKNPQYLSAQGGGAQGEWVHTL